MRLQSDEIAELDAWIAAQPGDPKPSRPEALRRRAFNKIAAGLADAIEIAKRGS